MTERQHSESATDNAAFARRTILIVVVVAVVGLAGFVFVSALHVMLLLFAGAIFGRFLMGAARLISKRSPLSYRLGLLIVVVILIGLTVLTFAYVVPHITEQVAKLTDELSDAWKQLHEHVQNYKLYQKLKPDSGQPSDWIGDSFDAWATIGGIFSTTSGALTGMGIILFVGFYLAVDPDPYARGVVALFPKHRRSRVQEVLEKMSDTLGWWILGRLASMTVIGVLVTLGLWLMDIPVPLSLGLLAALLTFIPNLGPLIALIPPAVLALRDGPSLALAVIGFYLAVQIVESYFLTPLIQQRSVALPPALTISAQVVLATFTGILGLAVATPLAAVALVLVREVYVKDILEAPP